MAEVAGMLLRRKPKQVFTIFVTWNLGALWRRIKKFQRPWAPYNPSRKLEVPADKTTEVQRSSEKYLRPSKEINPYAPEIIALAMKLGMKEKNKKDYAKAAYSYVKNNIYWYMEVPPTGAVNILKKGYGLCFSKTMLLAALARVAGIPARFVSYKQKMEGGFWNLAAEEVIGAELAHELGEESPAFTHGCVELLLDEKWMPVDITWTDEEEAGLDMRITEFGDSPFEKWYHVIPGSITRSENPKPMSKMKYKMALTTFLLRGAYDRVNKRFNNIREAGRKKLEEIGKENYMARKRKLDVPSVPLIFDE